MVPGVVLALHFISWVVGARATLAMNASLIVNMAPLVMPLSARELGLVVALALVPTVVGHSLMNRAMKHYRGSVVSVSNLGQFVFAGVNAWVLFGEVPKASFWPAAGLVVLGAALALRGGHEPAASAGEA